jgi:hypothetical protein
MSIQKFKTFEEAEKALWCKEPDENYYKRINNLFELAYRLNPPNYPRGIFKYKTLEEANKQKEEWILENAKRKGLNQTKSNF